jgi:hypothetical protein
MWMLSFVPDQLLTQVIHAVLILGIVGFIASYFASKIPVISSYALPLQLIFFLLLVGGVYFEGSIQTEKEWRNKVAELEEKVRASEEKSREVNTVIQTKYIEKVKKVKEVEFQIVEKIKEVEKVIDAKCELDPSVISILNEAARGAK